jgi:hypothetical protein
MNHKAIEALNQLIEYETNELKGAESRLEDALKRVEWSAENKAESTARLKAYRDAIEKLRNE